MQVYSHHSPLTLLGIQISFTANYPLETCKQLLLDSQVIPTRLMDLFGASRLKFSFSSVNTDSCEFEAERRVRRTVVKAKGYLQEIDDNATAIVGYVDAKISFYVVLLLILAIGLLIAARIYNGTLDGLYISSAVVLMFLVTTFVNALIVRRNAKALARIIEQTLNRYHQPMT